MSKAANMMFGKFRHGLKLVTLKEVDYSDDEKEDWLQRNRTALETIEK